MSGLQTNLVGRTVKLVESERTGTIVAVFLYSGHYGDIRYVITETKGDDRDLTKTYKNGDFTLMPVPEFEE